MLSLYKWQSECLKIWSANGYRGIVNAITGSGKTMLAISAITHLEIASKNDLRVKIVVPQTFLALQWRDELKSKLGVKTSEIGIYSGKVKNPGRKYTIYVINSARYSLARHILDNLKEEKAVFLIADECHHYGSLENNRIFDFYKKLEPEMPYYALGLSATPEIVSFDSISIPLGQEIYSYDLNRALKDRIISQFILFSIDIEFTKEEEREHDELSNELTKGLLKLKKAYSELHSMTSGAFFAYLNRLATYDYDESNTARRVLNLMYRRRAVSHMAANRMHCVMSLIDSLSNRLKIILFCERIETANELHKNLQSIYTNQVGIYHSKMPEHIRREVLDDYKYGSLRLLVCCKALDEGLNIPSTDAGILVSSSLSSRQRIQRLGRMLRHSKDIKRVYYLYISKSSEDNELARGLKIYESNIPVITLQYQADEFVNKEYERLRKIVIEYVISQRDDSELIDAIDRNLRKALIRGDFLISEYNCRERIKLSRSISESNYWKSVLYIILVRLGEI